MLPDRMAHCVWAATVALLTSCTSTNTIPDSLQAQIDHTLTFTQLKESPSSYRGRLVLFGGEVLTAKRLKEGTRIEVLQLPLDGYQAPQLDRTLSQGRFLAFQKDFLDPATVPPGTQVTIVGEVTGATTMALDETDYTYPTVEIKSLKIWQQPLGSSVWPRPYVAPYYWGPYWGRYPYWW
ncbi:MAG TPA: Slp family lipoprotein [Nitrospiraceae bacterium]|nr:Slp family lipoprotein [Nitrospiraceae bacterium]